MGFFIQNKQNQRNIERFVLFFYGLYTIYFCISASKRGWEAWITVFMIMEFCIAFILLLSGCKNYHFRAAASTILIQFTIILYASNMDDLLYVIPHFMTLTVLTAFYGIHWLIWIPSVSVLFLAFFHSVIRHTFAVMDTASIFQLAALACNIFCIEFLLYRWLKQRIENNNQVYEMIDALTDAEQSRDDFLSNISHEIRTPVNTISGMSEMALRETKLPKIREEIFDIRDAGRNLMTLVDDILDFSQLQKGKIALEEETYNITSTINDIINTAIARKGSKSIELIVDCDPSIPSGLFGDEKKIRRVILNLVDNAIKFTTSGCICIDIGARREEYGINLCVTIKDTGIGISEENIEKLFESFSQLDTRKSRQNGGIGLGLAISKALILKMGGTISVKSHLGKGSSFRFVVPQKIQKEKPIGQVHNTQNLNIATYFDMEQFDMLSIRGSYTELICHMIHYLHVKCHVCRNLAELKRRQERESFSHIFISLEEYQEDPPYFDLISEHTNVILIIERFLEKKISNPNLIRLYKPFYILPVISILNGTYNMEDNIQITCPKKFIAEGVHVLVVDDNHMNIRVIEGLLKEYHMKVSYAASGQEALKQIEQQCFDFVFMDYMMPEMDGIETLYHIRNKTGIYYQNVPIIALTANAAPGSREIFLKEGFTDFISKPVELSVLERVLKRIIPKDKLIYQTENTKKENPSDDNFQIGDLDVNQGLLYCGSRQAYLDILESCRTEGADNRAMLHALFQNQDWKNYTIKVHALKSSMQSIGAIPLSKKAKALEHAGKQGDIAYIQENHEDLLKEYCRVMEELNQSPLLHTVIPLKSELKPADLLELDEETFDAQIKELENAMYELDKEQMLSVLSKLQEYEYHKIPLSKKLIPVKKKIEMSDYMSAVDTISKIRENLKNGKE